MGQSLEEWWENVHEYAKLKAVARFGLSGSEAEVAATDVAGELFEYLSMRPSLFEDMPWESRENWWKWIIVKRLIRWMIRSKQESKNEPLTDDKVAALHVSVGSELEQAELWAEVVIAISDSRISPDEREVIMGSLREGSLKEYIAATQPKAKSTIRVRYRRACRKIRQILSDKRLI